MSASPFSRPSTGTSDAALEAKTTSTKAKLVKMLDDLFVNSIPSDDVKQLPPKYMYVTGFTILFLLLGSGLAIFTSGYYTLLKTQYLAPLDAGPKKYCSSVEISNSGKYLATKAGIWEGQQTFSYANATYELNIANLQLNDEEDEYYMMELYGYLNGIGEGAMGLTLAENLISWMSWVAVLPDHNSQRFYMTGTPLAVFDRQHTIGTISNVHADCNASSIGFFNPNSASIAIEYNIHEFMSNPTCNTTAVPEIFGYTPLAHTDNFYVSFDTQSLATAIAINNDIIQSKDMQATEYFEFSNLGQMYQAASYVDPRYPSMDPIFCLELDCGPTATAAECASGNSSFCAIQVDGYYALPFLHDNGASHTQPMACSCSNPTPGSLDNATSACNEFNFLLGFMFWANAGDPTPLLKYYLTSGLSYQQMREYAYKPMFSAGAYGMASPDRDSFNSPADRESNYAFCNLTGYGTCSIGTFSSFDTSKKTWVVSLNLYQVKTGACTDSFSTPVADWSKLYEVPYAPLHQEYQTCRYDPFNAFVNQAGITAGNMPILASVAVAVVLLCLGIYQKTTGRAIPRAYSSQDKADALEALALGLLLVRDGRLSVTSTSPTTTSSSSSSSSLSTAASVSTAAGSSHSKDTGDASSNNGSSGSSNNSTSGGGYGSKNDGSIRRQQLKEVSHVSTIPTAAAGRERGKDRNHHPTNDNSSKDSDDDSDDDNNNNNNNNGAVHASGKQEHHHHHHHHHHQQQQQQQRDTRIKIALLKELVDQLASIAELAESDEVKYLPQADPKPLPLPLLKSKTKNHSSKQEQQLSPAHIAEIATPAAVITSDVDDDDNSNDIEMHATTFNASGDPRTRNKQKAAVSREVTAVAKLYSFN